MGRQSEALKYEHMLSMSDNTRKVKTYISSNDSGNPPCMCTDSFSLYLRANRRYCLKKQDVFALAIY